MSDERREREGPAVPEQEGETSDAASSASGNHRTQSTEQVGERADEGDGGTRPRSAEASEIADDPSTHAAAASPAGTEPPASTTVSSDAEEEVVADEASSDKLAGSSRSGKSDDAESGKKPEPRTPSGIWSRQTIEARARKDGLFYDEHEAPVFEEKRLDPASYRLAIGGEIYISPAKAKDKASVTFLDPREAFFIPPGQFAFLLSEEVVKVPGDAFALIALRTRTKFKGLVNVSGFHADPGYHGRLIFAVFNAGPGDVHLRRGDDLFTISFAWLDEETSRPRSEEERFLHIPSEIITPIAGEVQSLAGLKESIDEVNDGLGERLHSVEREVAILRWAFALALSIVVGLLVRFLGSR